MKRILSLILCLAMGIGMVGCTKTRGSKNGTDDSKANTITSNEESNETADDGPGPLQVYYVSQGSSGQIAGSLMKWYKAQENAQEIETTSFNSAAELEAALDQEDQPDIIILDKYTSGHVLNPFQWAKDGRLTGLSQYLADDVTYDRANYINGVMDAGKYGDEQYIVPLAVSGQYLLANSEEVEVGGLSDLSGEYTMNMVLETMLADAKTHEGESDYYSQIPYSFSIGSVSQWMYDCLEQTGALHVDRKAKSVTIHQEMFELTMEYFRNAFQSVDPFLSGQTNVSAMSFADVEGVCTAIIGNHNMIHVARYMSSACHQLLNQEAVMIPFKLAEGGYSFNVNVFGMVNANSDQPLEAFQFLRTLMDFSHEQWEMIAMDDAVVTMSPVNKNEALALIESFESMSGGKYKIQTDIFEREVLSAEMAEELRSIIAETQQAFIVDAQVCDVLATYLTDYFNGQTDDLDGVAEQIKGAIEAAL